MVPVWLKRRMFRTISTHHDTRMARFAAYACRRYLDAFGNVNFGPDSNGERHLIGRLPSICTAFDVGAHHGAWAEILLDVHPRADVHCFEIASAAATRLEARLGGRVVVNAFGLGAINGTATLYEDDVRPDMTSLIPTAGRLESLAELRTGDSYCREHGIESIDLLKIDTEGFDLEVLRGFAELLAARRISVIQFEYTMWNIRSRALLADFYGLLEPLGYHIGKMRPTSIELKPYDELDEDFRGPNCVAVLADRPELVEAVRGAG